jgi:hypothetical protein
MKLHNMQPNISCDKPMARFVERCRNGHNLETPGAFRVRRYWHKKFRKYLFTRLCNTCRKGQYRRATKRRGYQTQKKVRESRRKKGLCIMCGQRPPQVRHNGKVMSMCFECLRRDAAKAKRARNKENGRA